MQPKTDIEKGASVSVSVIIPACNAERWLAGALESVRSQTYRDYEIIVIDDGSTDNTRSVLDTPDCDILYHHKQQGGAASARNAGIRLARGRYVAFLDADDMWLPEKLQRQMRLFDENPDLMWSYTSALFVEGATGRLLYTLNQIQRLLEGEVLRPLLLNNFIKTPTLVVRRDAFETVGYFTEAPELLLCEDLDMWLRLAAHYPIKGLSEPLAKIRLHAEQTSRREKLERLLQHRLAVLGEAIRREPERLADLRSLAESNLYTNVGWEWFNLGERKRARSMLWKATAAHPKSCRAWIYWLASFLPESILQFLISLLRSVRNRQWSSVQHNGR